MRRKELDKIYGQKTLFCEIDTFTANMFPQYFNPTRKDDKSFDINKASEIALRCIRKRNSTERKVFVSINPSSCAH